MKIIRISSLALCQFPLLESSRPTVQPSVRKAKWHPEKRLMDMVTKFCRAIISWVALGFEDEDGFHYDQGAGQFVGFRIHCRAQRPPTLTRNASRRTTIRPANLNLDRPSVIQRGSSSPPPCRVLSKSLSACPRRSPKTIHHRFRI